MAAYYTTPLPGVMTTPGPAWATQLNQVLTLIEGHNHTGSDEQKVPASAVIFNSNITPTNNMTFTLGAPGFLWSGIYTNELVIAALSAANSPTPLFLNGSLAPSVDNFSSLGTSILRFSKFFVMEVALNDLAGMNGNPILTNDDIVPVTDNTVDLGAPDKMFRNVYATNLSVNDSYTVVNLTNMGVYNIDASQTGYLFTNVGVDGVVNFILPVSTGSGAYYNFNNLDLSHSLTINTNGSDVINFLDVVSTGNALRSGYGGTTAFQGASIIIVDVAAGMYSVISYMGNWQLATTDPETP